MYEIIRFFDNGTNERLYANFSREEALEFCKSKETSSLTCSDETRAEVPGNWFIGFRKM